MYKLNIKFSDGKHRVERAPTLCYATALLRESEMHCRREGHKVVEAKIWRTKDGRFKSQKKTC